MAGNIQTNECRSFVVCLDTLDGYVMAGSFYENGKYGIQRFTCLYELIFGIDEMLAESHRKQRRGIMNRLRKKDAVCGHNDTADYMHGKLATFIITISAVQKSTWQGKLRWIERGTENSFSSVSELMSIVNSKCLQLNTSNK